MRRLDLASCSALLLAICASLLPITGRATIITSGSVTVGTGGFGAFDFAGDTFTASGSFSSWFGGWNVLSNPFAAGSQVNINGGQCCNDLSGAIVTIGSATYTVDIHNLEAQRGSWLSFAGSSITLDRGAGLYEAAFTFSGSICGTLVGPGIRPCIVDLPDLIGFGTVYLDVISTPGVSPDRPLFMVDRATYAFSVPEPATLSLFIFGLAGLGITRSRSWLLRSRD
jgi:hypothetical protein